jgi:hypothetical protein
MKSLIAKTLPDCINCPNYILDKSLVAIDFILAQSNVISNTFQLLAYSLLRKHKNKNDKRERDVHYEQFIKAQKEKNNIIAFNVFLV